jgi:hypothetical protein
MSVSPEPPARGPFSARVVFRDPWSVPSSFSTVAPGNSGAQEGARFLNTQICKDNAMTKRGEAKYKIDAVARISGAARRAPEPPRIRPRQHGQRRKGKLRTSTRWAPSRAEGLLRQHFERQFHGIYVAGR